MSVKSAVRPGIVEEVLRGLRSPQKELPCKLFYDRVGSELFEQITELDEYYPTRAELRILREFSGDIASHLGPDCILVEYGSGSSTKTRLLLDHLDRPAAYVPIDISRDLLEQSAADLSRIYPDLVVVPVCADYTQRFDLPGTLPSHARRVA